MTSQIWSSKEYLILTVLYSVSFALYLHSKLNNRPNFIGIFNSIRLFIRGRTLLDQHIPDSISFGIATNRVTNA